ncbi:DUF4062 domain-containing protein [Pedobacter sp. UC225_61]|uniref:DUF4062 domain-containing protein n=1 Tax=Pedobacter sp. UC225_61 TaxID=3374623 RepID=UPI003797810E
MAKPRVFLSSTYFDLKHVRRHVEAFIKQMGYESVLFESGDIPFHHDQALDESCYAEIDTCHILILIIGGRYGSSATNDATQQEKEQKEKEISFYNSITKKEYEKAREKGIPIFIFVEKGVYGEYDTFKKNRTNKTISFAHVDSVNIFRLLDEIIAQRTNNFVKGFENFDDITTWLKEQWAGIFADFLSRRTTDTKIKNLQEQIEELKEISGALKVYNEAILVSTKAKDGTKLIKQEELKLRIRKASRFKREPLIDYIIKAGNKEINTLRLYEYFTITKTLEEFAEKIIFDKGFINSFSRRAHEEYKKIRNVYLDENNPVDHKEIEGFDEPTEDTN